MDNKLKSSKMSDDELWEDIRRIINTVINDEKKVKVEYRHICQKKKR